MGKFYDQLTYFPGPKLRPICSCGGRISTVFKANELGVSSVEFASNSSNLIRAVNSKSMPPELFGILSDISLVHACFNEISFIILLYINWKVNLVIYADVSLIEEFSN